VNERLFHTFIRIAGALVASVMLLHATSIDPQCSSTLTNMAVVGGSSTSFCVSDYGWSNGWFATGAPGDYPSNTSINLLGDSGQAISYTLGGTTYTAWITPLADGRHTNSDFTIVTPVTGTNTPVTIGGTTYTPGTGSQVSSVVTDGRIDITIVSTDVNNNLLQTFTVTNETSQTLTNINFLEYFNYFPYGAGNQTSGTLSYQTVPTLENTSVYGLWANGTYGTAGFIRSGGVCGGVGTSGCTTPNAYQIGTPSSVVQSVNYGSLLDGTTSASNDASGALSWDVSNLNLGQGGSQAFTVELVPEPETIALLLIGLAGIYVGRRKF